MKWEYISFPVIIREETFVVKEYAECFMAGELQFNLLGKKEWELVSVDNGIAYFKRPIQNKEIPSGVSNRPIPYPKSTYFHDDGISTAIR